MRSRTWITGQCWLYCLRPQVPVMWIGPVWAEGQQAGLYACEGCVQTLNGLIRTALHRRDRAPAR
ncbi:hypothetical protein CUT44_21515 [Streptomyces carminius]|uniref:Uncharacterized protein n=1 Tax=Streptomyces carminius TaxID=2665496 RepID=A0A2M8LV31_9ACTN|nr:hypothetical protein [Streptomyces carminius]PJE95831.1 hypothetical protein CUT44_21515 [Streptomyces carminius]